MRLAEQTRKPPEKADQRGGERADPDAAQRGVIHGTAEQDSASVRVASGHIDQHPLVFVIPPGWSAIHACILLLLLTSCKSSSEAKSATHLDLALDKQLSGMEAVTEHTKRDPSLILEFAPRPPSPDGAGPRANAQSTHSAGSKDSLRGRVAAVPPPVADGLPPHGDLLKATFVGGSTDDIERLARIEAAARLKAKADAEAEAAKKNAPAGLLGSLVGLWPLFLIAAFALAGFVGWKLLRARLP